MSRAEQEPKPIDVSVVAGVCQVCGATRTRELYTATDRLRNSDLRFSIVECLECGVLRTLPEMSPEELGAYYPSAYWGHDDEPSREWILNSQSEKLWFLEKCRLRNGRLLDVGCGSGLFLRALDVEKDVEKAVEKDDEKWERYGVETGAEAAEVAARYLGEGHILNTTLAKARLPDGDFDVVTIWSALEHMPDPKANLSEARRLIKNGGTLIVQVPNVNSYQARAFKGDWFSLDAPRHRYHFSLDTLDRLLAATGFEIYEKTFYSRAHNAHALRQSLKGRLVGKGSSVGFGLFCLTIPFLKPIDLLFTSLGQGATLTVAARAIQTQ